MSRANIGPLAKLRAAKSALEDHEPVPRHVAEWLAQAIGLYVHGRRASLDDALGLKAKGRASPLRNAREAGELQAALSRMLGLQMRGATIPQAAALVNSLLPQHSAATLADRYRRNGYTAVMRETRSVIDTTCDPEPTLSEYPDEPLEVAQAKKAIRAMYAKRRT